LRRGLRLLALAGLVGGLGYAASVSPVGFALEQDRGLPWLFALRGTRPAPPEAVVVRFDREAFARFRELPTDAATWPQPLAGCAQRFAPIGPLDGVTALDRMPRGVQACLVEELTRRGAAVLAFDVTFRRDPTREAGVPALAAAIRAHGRVILLDMAMREPPQASSSLAENAGVAQADLLERPETMLADAALATTAFVLPRGSTLTHQFWAFNPALPTDTQLPTRALEALALPTLVRLAAAAGREGPGELPPGELLQRHIDWFRAQTSAGGRWAELAAAAAPSAAETRAVEALARTYRGRNAHYLNFYGPSGAFRSISAADLLIPDAERRRPAEIADLQGKVAFVGYQELAISQARDSFPTAFQGPNGVDLGGVEIAATAFANLLHDETLGALPEWARVLLVGALGFALTLTSCLSTLWRGLAATLALAVAYAAAAFAAFTLWHFWLPVVIPLLGLLPLALVLGQAVHYLGAARWLGVYAPHQVSRRLLEGGDFAAGQAESREVTVMLTDIVGFTTLAERSTPASLTEFVNRHFTMLNACVEAEGGTVAQFIGDSVMSFWGAPDPQPDHAARACRAALAIGRALVAENERRARQALPPVRMRIGINTGEVTAGNVGAPGRSNYSIVGDTVNTTQRIEQLAKTLLLPDRPTVAMLVSSRTRLQAGVGFDFTDAGLHELRGRREPVRIFRLHPTLAAVAVEPDRDERRGTRRSAGG
jgi:adenylate cyclase